MPPLRPKERLLVLLILGTFGFVSFSAVLYLPDKTTSSSDAGGGGGANKVYKVYKELENAGRDLILPPPPHADPGEGEGGALEAPAVGRVRKVNDKAKFIAQVELDQEIQDLHRKQVNQMQQLPKPNIRQK